jgi:hypothetical protein
MSCPEPLYQLLGIDSENLSKEESILLEADLYIRFWEEMEELFRGRYQDYFKIMKFSQTMEKSMLETKYIILLLNDILLSGEYTIEGIAKYTDSPVDLIQEFLTELNKTPSAIFLRKLLDLHRTVRRELYNTIIKKIALDYLSEFEQD